MAAEKQFIGSSLQLTGPSCGGSFVVSVELKVVSTHCESMENFVDADESHCQWRRALFVFGKVPAVTYHVVSEGKAA